MEIADLDVDELEAAAECGDMLHAPTQHAAVPTSSECGGDSVTVEKKSSAAKSAATSVLHFKCALCLRMGTISDRVPGHQWERECKRAYDALGRLAIKQGESEWWAATRSDAKKHSDWPSRIL